MFDELYEQWKMCTKSQKLQHELTGAEVQEILEFHPYNYCDRDKNYNIYEKLRDNYYELWDEQKCMEKIISDFQQIKNISKSDGCKVVRKFPSMIYCLTIAPQLNKPQYLCDIVKDVISCKQVVKYIGVFEVGRKRENFHTHLLLESNNKNMIQNIKKKMNLLNVIYKIDKIKSSVHLLKTLRYMFGKEKINKGVINRPSLNEWISLCELNNSNFLNETCESTIYEDRVWNM